MREEIVNASVISASQNYFHSQLIALNENNGFVLVPMPSNQRTIFISANGTGLQIMKKISPVHKGAIKTCRPKYPPFVFKGVPASFSRSTSRTQSRSERLSRSEIEFDDMDVFIEQDKVGSLDEIAKKLGK